MRRLLFCLGIGFLFFSGLINRTHVAFGGAVRWVTDRRNLKKFDLYKFPHVVAVAVRVPFIQNDRETEAHSVHVAALDARHQVFCVLRFRRLDFDVKSFVVLDKFKRSRFIAPKHKVRVVIP
jgi:hypothetical protein